MVIQVFSLFQNLPVAPLSRGNPDRDVELRLQDREGT